MTVEVLESEILSRVTPAQWAGMMINERRMLVSLIMRARTDAASHFAGRMMERGIPVFNDFVIIRGR